MSGGTAMAVSGFDYGSLPPALAEEAREAADRIRTRLQASYIETGRDLIAIKQRLEHGHFGAWLKAEFAMSERTCENYMGAARLADKSATVAVLPPAAVYCLAAPSTPASVVDEVLAAVEAGKRPTVADIKARIATAADAERKAASDARKTPEQRRKVAEAERRRQQRRAAERSKWEAQQNAREAEARDQSRAVAEWLLRRLGPWKMAELLVLARGVDWRDMQRHFETSPGALMSALQIAEAFNVNADGSPMGALA